MKAIEDSVKINRQDVGKIKIKINKFLNEIFYLNLYDYRFIGSAGKVWESSDIDIAILNERIDIDSAIEILDMNNVRYRVFKGFDEISIAFDFQDKVYQVDLMFVSNLDWAEFFYSSPDIFNGESKYKAVYRNLLLMSYVICLSRQYLTENIFQQMSLSLRGLSLTKKSNIGKGGKIIKTPIILDTKIITDDKDSIMKSIGLFEYDISTFEKLFDVLKDFDHFDAVIEKFIDYCNNLKIQIPMGVTKKMVDTEYEQMDLWISEILEEANGLGLRYEVYSTAQEIMMKEPTIEIIEAYKMAFDEWVK